MWLTRTAGGGGGKVVGNNLVYQSLHHLLKTIQPPGQRGLRPLARLWRILVVEFLAATLRTALLAADTHSVIGRVKLTLDLPSPAYGNGSDVVNVN